MKRAVLLVITAAMILMGMSVPAYSSFNSGSTGADGAFNPTTNTQVQLPTDGKLNYTTVNIPSGVTVTFIKNAANTPVYMLATGNVTIAGTINVNGSNANTVTQGAAGPGGYNGGLGGSFALPGGKGIGPGGGGPSLVNTNSSSACSGGGGGGFGATGSNGQFNTGSTAGTGGSSYGNVQIQPMTGGSGGGGGAGTANTQGGTGGGGGGGGGAILIASSGTINVTGSITANGGAGGSYVGYFAGGGAGGSGGAIKLMADTISGNGTISATGGAAGNGYYSNGGAGGSGRIRFEANSVTRTAVTNPGYTYDYPNAVFVTSVPTISITSVGGVTVPANPTGSFASPDVSLPSGTTNPVTIEVAGVNIPVGTTVTVTATPQYNAATSSTASLAGTFASSTATAQVTLSTQYKSIITATATFTLQTAFNYQDEIIERVRVASTMGGGSETVYIARSGREIKAGEAIVGLNN